MFNTLTLIIYSLFCAYMGHLINVEKWYDRGYQEGYEKAIREIEMEVLHGEQHEAMPLV